MDIWKTAFENGKWTEPVNLGPKVNTSGNEMSPFIHYDDQTLYFASDGHIGMGGTDIFVTRKNGDSWSEPVNLGYPINTGGDESSLIVDATASTAYFSSDRAGGEGKLDIYSFELPKQLRPTLTVCYKGTVSDAKNGKPVGSDIRIVDLKSGETVANTSSDEASGQYIISLPTGRSYAFHVTAKDYLFNSINVEGNREQKNIEKIDIKLNPIEAGSTIALRNIFFETGKADLLEESHYELGQLLVLLNNNPTLRVEIGGHTDNVGSDRSNQVLSEGRCKEVRRVMVERGIAPNRIQILGKGEKDPIVPNDTEEHRQMNRRVEIVLL
jgi:outer membrane protein OmpA-like peptidoglycan-associated protein